MTHPESEVLLRFAEGGAIPADASAHLAQCAECQAALGGLASFETHLAAESEMSEVERARLRDITRRTLPQRTPSLRRFAGITAVAAALLAAVLCWPRAHGLCGVDVHRYAPAGVVRSEAVERYALEVRIEQPRWLALWQLDAKGARRLMPHDDPLLRWLGAEMPLAPGKRRIPEAEVLDFEFASAAVPTGLLLVAMANEPSPADLAAIEKLVADTPRAQLAAAVQARWPEATLLDFPAK